MARLGHGGGRTPRTRRIVLASLLALTVVCPALADENRQTSTPKRILILHSFGPNFQPYSGLAASLRTELALRWPEFIEFDDISVVVARYTDDQMEQPLADYIQGLSSHRAPDLIVPIGGPALEFSLRHRERQFPGLPMLATGVDSRQLEGLGDNVAAVCVDIDFVGFIENIFQVLPDTRHVYAVFGASPLEQAWVQQSHQAWRSFDDRIEFTWLDELSLPEMRARVAQLPPNSVIAYVLLAIDAAGVPYEQNAALEALHSAANALIFGLFSQQMGRGVVGGQLSDFSRAGVEAGRMAARILAGESPAAISRRILPAERPVFDSRELDQWGIDTAALPPDSQVLFRPPRLWQAYRGRVITLVAFCLFEAVLIAMLLVVQRRLRSTRAQLGIQEQSLQELRRELNHADRVTLLGQFTTSLAHELGQPIGAILRNTEAAELILQAKPPDLVEIQSILDDIQHDGARAGTIVSRLRDMLSPRSTAAQELNWRRVVEEVVHIVRRDALQHRIALEIDVPFDLPAVYGDRVHLQQVLLNLVANAMDAVQIRPDGERRVRVSAHANGDGFLECAVSDTGMGIAPNEVESIFEPFKTSKPRGMGMGLPISRTIVEAHRGRLWAENRSGGGAIFRLSIPISEREEHHA